MFLDFINWNPSPEIFTIPGINWPVRWYGLLWAFAFIGSHFVMNRIYKAENRTEKELDLLTLYIILGTVLGARLGHCLFYDADYYLAHPLDILKVYEGGLASHGGAIGIVVAILLYCRKTKESILWMFDRIVVVVPFSAMCIRIGNLINGEIVGKVTDLPWGFRFLNNDEDKFNLKEHDFPIPVRHPAQLYEAIFCLGLFILFYWLWKNKRQNFGSGFMFGLLCVLLFIERFLDEFVKENQVSFEDDLTLNMGQILSIPFVIIGIYFMWKSGKNKTEASQMPDGEKGSIQ